MTERPLILIADDESKIRRLLAAAIENAGYDTASSDDGEAALKVFDSLTPAPDLVILDIMMPVLDGFEVLDALRKRSSVPVILLSARSDPADKVRALQHGADDYVTKPFSVEELVARIDAVMRRCRQISGPEPAARIVNGPLVLEPSSRKVTVGGRLCPLTDTEYRLLLLFMRHPETVLTHDALVRQVWGPESLGETGALRITLTRIRKKLATAGLEGIITSYSGVGYIMSDLGTDSEAVTVL